MIVAGLYVGRHCRRHTAGWLAIAIIIESAMMR